MEAVFLPTWHQPKGTCTETVTKPIDPFSHCVLINLGVERVGQASVLFSLLSLQVMKCRGDGLESPLDMGENPYTVTLDPALTCDEVENVFMVMWHRYLDPMTNRRKVR